MLEPPARNWRHTGLEEHRVFLHRKTKSRIGSAKKVTMVLDTIWKDSKITQDEIGESADERRLEALKCATEECRK